eukprot:132325-Alexandrium_andersonii.AAC.1
MSFWKAWRGTVDEANTAPFSDPDAAHKGDGGMGGDWGQASPGRGRERAAVPRANRGHDGPPGIGGGGHTNPERGGEWGFHPRARPGC